MSEDKIRVSLRGDDPGLVLGYAGFVISPESVHAVKYDLQARTPAYHYGTSGCITVNSSPAVVYQKVTGLVTFRTDWTSMAEIGHYWAGAPRAFYVYTDTFGLNTRDLGPVTPGSVQRYHTGYAAGDGLQYYWKNDSIVAKHWLYPQMTSQWPGINVERDTYDMTAGDNVGCFTGLKYKNYQWGSWSPWNGVVLEADNDPRYRLVVAASTHADFIFGY